MTALRWTGTMLMFFLPAVASGSANWGVQHGNDFAAQGSGVAWSASSQRGGLAVLGFECLASPATCVALESEVRTAFRRSGRFPDVERERIAEVMREQAIGHTRDFDDSTAIQVGRLLAAHYVCFGSIGPVSTAETKLERHVGLRSYVTLSLRVVSVERGSAIFSTSVTETQEGWRNVTPEEVLYVEAGRIAVREIMRQFENEVSSRGSIVEMMPGRRVLVDLGAQHGVAVGSVFAVLRDNGSAIGPDGTEVRRPDLEVGEIRVDEVGPMSSIARRVRGQMPRPGDRVVSKQRKKSAWDW